MPFDRITAIFAATTIPHSSSPRVSPSDTTTPSAPFLHLAKYSKPDPDHAVGPVRRKRVKLVLLLVLCVLFASALSFALSMYLNGRWSRNVSSYYVILDCGSTGTRVYVYEASVSRSRGIGGLPLELRPLPEDMERRRRNARSGRAYQRMETEPGFDKLVRNESGLRGAISPLVRWAEKQIPKSAHKSTFVYLYATAGVRRLPRSDSNWLLAKAWKILKHSSFSCKKEWVKIISGMEEAYYGWIALNYHMKVLGSVPAKETFGSLDLGGSSLQVTFETKGAMYDDASLKLSIGEVYHHLSAYSLSGYGLNDAFDKSVVSLIRQLPQNSLDDLKNGRMTLKHPCLQTGYKQQYLCSQCMTVNLAGSPLIGGKKQAKSRASVPVQLVGAPQWEECSALAKASVNLSEWSKSNPGIDCDIQPCALSSNLPKPRGEFYAMSGFFVVFKFFNLSSDSSPDDLLHRGQEFCEKSWESAKSSVVPQPFIEQYCFRAPYVASLLRDGLHIMDSDVVVGSGSITWTLGVALLEAGKALSSRTDIPVYRMLPKKIDLSVIIMLLMVSLFLLLILLLIRKCFRRFFRRAYLPLFRHKSASSSSVLTMSSPFNLQRWSPIITGDARAKMPLSPRVSASQQHPFGLGNGFGGSCLQLTDSSSHASSHSVSHSYSSDSLGLIHSDNGIGSFWAPHRSQMRLQSRRSQSREDLISSLGDIHMVKT